MARLRSSLLPPLVILFVWTGAQGLWIETDQRLPDWEAARDVGASEDWEGHWTAAAHEGQRVVLVRSISGARSGEYPALYPALNGALAATLGPLDWNGTAPRWLALLWAWLAGLGTWWMARELAVAAGDKTGRGTAAIATLVFLASPLYSALAREPLMEAGAVAWVALAGASGFRALRLGASRSGTAPGFLAWAGTGLFAGLALLTKQTTAFALLPLGLALLFVLFRTTRASEAKGGPLPFTVALSGPALALGLTAIVAGPWYLSSLTGSDSYLLDSARANPDAVGPLRQLVIYPAVLFQQAWAPLSWVGVIGGWAWSRRTQRKHLGGLWWVTMVVLGGSLVLLLGVPKKYPRLLLPLMPFAACLGAALLASMPARTQRLGVGALTLGWALSMGLGGSSLEVLGSSDLGLRQLDERCYQDWIRRPDPKAFDWSGLLAQLDAAGVHGPDDVVGSPEWPTPPCRYQTTLHLGEHLQLRLRRANLEAAVALPPWRPGSTRRPTVLLMEADSEWLVEARASGARPAGKIDFDHPEWPLQLLLYRLK